MAATVAQVINGAGTALVRANHSLELLAVSDVPLRPGVTVDHYFNVPGSLFDVIGYGPRLGAKRDFQDRLCEPSNWPLGGLW